MNDNRQIDGDNRGEECYEHWDAQCAKQLGVFSSRSQSEWDQEQGPTIDRHSPTPRLAKAGEEPITGARICCESHLSSVVLAKTLLA